MTRVALLRCGKLPSFVTWDIPNLEELFEEDILLQKGFEAQGFEASPVVWNQSDVDWNQYDIALIRSTWDYLDEQEEFLQVLSRIEASACKLFNPVAAVRWNIDKRYLFDLEKWDIPIIPTVLASESENIPKWFGNEQTKTVVLKPTIGLGGSHSYRVQLSDLPSKLEDVRSSHPNQQYLIQPFVEDIVHEGEWSYVFFNQTLSHVLLKKPAPNDYRVQGIYGGTIQPAEPKLHDLSLAQAVIKKLPLDILYARLDFVRVRGQLSIIEVELIEPIFSFNVVPESIARLVRATKEKFETYS